MTVLVGSSTAAELQVVFVVTETFVESTSFSSVEWVFAARPVL